MSNPLKTLNNLYLIRLNLDKSPGAIFCQPTSQAESQSSIQKNVGRTIPRLCARESRPELQPDRRLPTPSGAPLAQSSCHNLTLLQLLTPRSGNTGVLISSPLKGRTGNTAPHNPTARIDSRVKTTCYLSFEKHDYILYSSIQLSPHVSACVSFQDTCCLSMCQGVSSCCTFKNSLRGTHGKKENSTTESSHYFAEAETTTAVKCGPTQGKRRPETGRGYAPCSFGRCCEEKPSAWRSLTSHGRACVHPSESFSKHRLSYGQIRQASWSSDLRQPGTLSPPFSRTLAATAGEGRYRR